MKLLLTLMCSFLIIASPTNVQLDFEKAIHENYEKYYYLVSEETSVGDIVIVVGSIKNKVYVSGFIYSTSNKNHYFKLSNDKTYNNVFYKVKTSENMTISIESDAGTFCTYDIEYDTINKLNELDLKTGEGNNSFPKEKKSLDIIDIFIIGVFIFVGIIGVLSVLLLSLYRNKKGLFGNVQNQNTNNIYEEEIIEIEPITEEKKTKEELMEEAYNDYNSGKITEQELNNRLRRIWWSEDD